MRDCIFLVADSNMRACVEGFLGRPAYDKRLRTGPFQFDPLQDMLVGGNDPGVYERAHEVLRSFRSTHNHAVVILDNQWDGSPGPDQIAADVRDKLVTDGWRAAAIAVIVIDPELEAWFWQDSVHIEKAVAHVGPTTLRAKCEQDGTWPADRAKPTDPKGLLETMLERANRPRSSSLYREVTSVVTVRSCKDPAFQSLCDHLRLWFPGDAK